MKKNHLFALIQASAWICLLFAPSCLIAEQQPSLAIKVEKHSWTLGFKPDESIIYNEPANGKPLKLDCFYPVDHRINDNRGCIIFFFGGGWSGGDTKQFYGFSKYFSSRGLVAIAAQYRTKKSHQAAPRDCVEDGKKVIRYVRANAKKLRIDPNQIILGGGSAGGHVAASTVMCPKIDGSPESSISCVPNALILFNPVYDNGPSGYGHSRVTEYWEDISPMHNVVAGLPPTIVFFGDGDIHVPVTTINTFQKKMTDAGNKCETHIYDNQTHGFFHISKGGRKMFQDVLIKADSFLVDNGYLTGEDAVENWTEQAIKDILNKKN